MGLNARLTGIIFLFALLLPGVRAQAMSEVELDKHYEDTIVPYYAQHGVDGTLLGRGGVSLHYRVFLHPAERGALVFLTGRGQTYARYGELVYDLAQLGYSVYLFDHRGQGLSGRLAPDRRLSHVDNFEDYISDLKMFFDQVVHQRSPNTKHIVLAHSMSGAIGALYVQHYPNDFQGAIFSAPMFGFLQTPKSSWTDWPKMVLYSWIGRSKQDSAPDEKKVFTTFENNVITHSHVRFVRSFLMVASNDLLRMGGTTYGWVAQSFRAMWSLRRAASEIQIPVLALVASEEAYVDNGRVREFCSAAPKCKYVLVEGGRHDLYNESDPYRNLVLSELDSFIGTIK